MCGHRFMREAGFFQGAMFVSYAVGVVELIVLSVVAYIFLASRIGVAPALVSAGAVHLLLVPQLFEYSRVIWAHIVAGSESESHPPPPPTRQSR